MLTDHNKTAAELTEDMDDNLFQRILGDKNHILHALLPERRRSLEYELRPRTHDRELVPKVNSLTESNFLIRQLYKNYSTSDITLPGEVQEICH